ncbi:MAG: hypothetical protein IIZ73_03280 [Ruminococcus sp.]|nr:hypothetical protein [Ruminococcus sp.]
MATKKVEEAKAEAVKTEAAKPAAKKAPAKKSAAKKTPAAKKTDQKKVVTVVEFADKQVDVDVVAEACRADFKANNKGNVRSLNVYIKPEDNAAYYVVNGKVSGKVDL